MVKSRNAWLDVLRGLAILGVVFCHSIQMVDTYFYKNSSKVFSNFFNLGRYGVALFFFLSGWLLASIYNLSKHGIKKSYWLKRSARIYPLWLLFLLVAFLRWSFTDSGRLNSPLRIQPGQSEILHSWGGVIFLTITFTLFISSSLWNGVIPGGWSIQSEVAHYVLFPLLRRWSLNGILLACFLLNAITLILIQVKELFIPSQNLMLQALDAWIRWSIFTTISYFVLGIVGFKIANKYQNFRSNKKDLFSEINLYLTFLFLLSFIAVPYPFGNQVEGLGFVCIMVFISRVSLRIPRLSQGLQLLGKYSYFIYFMHFILLASVNWILERIFFTDSLRTVQEIAFFITTTYVLMFSLLFAVPSMKFFERPIMNFASRVR
jgi:peptidoglycan/LPS O-acetylase OafA/YrhL